MNRGRPSPHFLAGAYWRHREGLPQNMETADPGRDGCGLLWLPPVLPFRGAAVRELLALAGPIFAAHGFDFFITLNTVTERALSAIMTIAYDKGSAKETAAALACYDDLLAATLAAGFPPYRLTSRAMGAVMGGAVTGFDGKALAGLKAWLDPAGQISPGRYEGP